MFMHELCYDCSVRLGWGSVQGQGKGSGSWVTQDLHLYIIDQLQEFILCIVFGERQICFVKYSSASNNLEQLSLHLKSPNKCVNILLAPVKKYHTFLFSLGWLSEYHTYSKKYFPKMPTSKRIFYIIMVIIITSFLLSFMLFTNPYVSYRESEKVK